MEIGAGATVEEVREVLREMEMERLGRALS